MAQPDRTVKPGNKMMEIAIITILMAFGALYLYSKVGRDEPVKFTSRSLPENAIQTLRQADASLQRADNQSLKQAQTGYAWIMERHPDFPPAHAKWALSQILLATKFPDGNRNPALALQSAENVLHSFPEQKDALLAQAFALENSKPNYLVKQKLARAVLKQDRYNQFALYLLASSSYELGKYKLALRDAQTLALQEPHARWLRLPACQYSIKAGLSEEAIKTCEWVAAGPAHAGQDQDQMAALIAKAKSRSGQ